MKPLTVTLDSCVWERIVRPESPQASDAQELYAFLQDSAREGKFLGFVSEGVFDLEAIGRNQRRAYLSNYKPIIREVSGRPHHTVVIEPDRDSHPKPNSKLTQNWQEAMSLGFRLLYATQMPGMPKSGYTLPSMFAPILPDELLVYQARFLDVLIKMASEGWGDQRVRQLGNSAKKPSDANWLQAIRRLDDSNREFKDAVAEWADGLAIASHVAARNDYFCTTDVGSKAGTKSILSVQNRAKLRELWDIEIVSPNQLVQIINCA